MIRQVKIENFKSINDLELDLGRVSVLIGANGSGKSNILEAMAFAWASVQDKLDNEFLTSRGIRVTEARFMCSAFAKQTDPHSGIPNSLKKRHANAPASKPIKVTFQGGKQQSLSAEIVEETTASFPKWTQTISSTSTLGEVITRQNNLPPGARITQELLSSVVREDSASLKQFLVYAPENSSLRTFSSEGQILPLGIKGEGLFSHLKSLSDKRFRDRLERIKDRLSLIDWYGGFEIPEILGPGERSIRIRDRYLPEGVLFDQLSANEGFLFLLFYLTLFISPDTPDFFSIDNIDSSLNPKLCVTLLKQIINLSREFDKQVILTTHNPAVLDGLDLTDEEQRLIVVDRTQFGHTRLRRIQTPRPKAGQQSVSLSEAFMRGYIGGLPKSF